MMYSMKEACVQTGMSYETLKFYCKEGLVPNVKRDSHNYRVFDDRDIKWIQSLGCLKRCGMTLAEMKEYLAYCLEGPSSIPERKEILAVKKEALLPSMEKLQKARSLQPDIQMENATISQISLPKTMEKELFIQ